MICFHAGNGAMLDRKKDAWLEIVVTLMHCGLVVSSVLTAELDTVLSEAPQVACRTWYFPTRRLLRHKDGQEASDSEFIFNLLEGTQ